MTELDKIFENLDFEGYSVENALKAKQEVKEMIIDLVKDKVTWKSTLIDAIELLDRIERL